MLKPKFEPRSAWLHSLCFHCAACRISSDFSNNFVTSVRKKKKCGIVESRSYEMEFYKPGWLLSFRRSLKIQSMHSHTSSITFWLVCFKALAHSSFLPVYYLSIHQITSLSSAYLFFATLTKIFPCICLTYDCIPVPSTVPLISICGLSEWAHAQN